MNAPPLRIAMIIPPWYALPPGAYGGTEAVCAELVEELVARGHEVTVIGAGRSRTSARSVATYQVPQTERLGETLPELVHAAAAQRAVAGLDVDLVHDHTLAGPMLAGVRSVPTVVTAHNLADKEWACYYRQLGDSMDIELVAISSAQRRLAPDLHWSGTVPNGIRTEDFPYREEKDDFVLFLGRCAPAKGPHLAIDAARAADCRILLAGRCAGAEERAYFAEQIEPRLGPTAQWLGEIGRDRKLDLLARARCLLFPVRWEEPFGMVMVEAMACGTPVVALRRGAVPEIVLDGVTGFVRDEPDELPEALRAVPRLEPGACRERVRRCFHVSTMATGYEEVYRRTVAAWSEPLRITAEDLPTEAS